MMLRSLLAAPLVLPLLAVAAPGQAGTLASAPQRLQSQSSAGCYEEAQDRTLLTQQQAASLCRGSHGDPPVSCFEAAMKRTFLSDWPGVRLCQCARGVRPVNCFERASEETDLTEHQIVGRCRARRVHDLNANCEPRGD